MADIAIYAYYYPPQVSAGSQRPARLAKMLMALGHQVTIYTIPTADTQNDVTQIDVAGSFDTVCEIPDPLTKFALRRSLLFQKLINFVAIPDLSIGHAIRVYWAMRNANHEIVITTSAPISAHVTGALLAKKTFWIADIRDSIKNNPSTNLKRIKPIGFYAGLLLNKLIDSRSQLTLTASRTISEDFDDVKTDVFYNGFANENSWDKVPISSSKFIIGYIGSLYAERDPQIFLAAFKTFINMLSDTERLDIELQFIGNHHPSAINKLKSYREYARLKVSPYQNKATLFDIANEWSILLLLVDEVPYSKGVITGKIFDYLCLNGKVLAIATPDSEIGEILRKTKKGNLFSKKNPQAIADSLFSSYLDWKEKRLDIERPNIVEIEKFSYFEQRRHLETLLDKYFSL